MNTKSNAIELFKKHYGKTPEEAGFPEIEVFEKQQAFLYATSSEVIRAYKTQQNIMKWIVTWYFGPMFIGIITLIWAFLKYHDPWHIICLSSYIFFSVWILLFMILYIKMYFSKHYIRFGETITYLNY